MSSHRLFCLVATLLAAVAAGCGTSRPPEYAVSGRVQVGGKPAGRAKVFFHPLSRGAGPSALSFVETGPDGNFRLTAEAGVPAGEYAVTVIWPQYRQGGDEEVEAGDRLKGKYADPAHPVSRVTIGPGDNALPPFELRP